MEGEIVSPDRDQGGDVRITFKSFGCDHPFIGDPHGMNQPGFDRLNNSRQLFCRGGDRENPKPLSDSGSEFWGGQSANQAGSARVTPPLGDCTAKGQRYKFK